MAKTEGKWVAVARALLAVVIFSVFLKLDTLLGIANASADRGWSLSRILFAVTLIRMVFAAFVVLVVLPLILRMNPRRWLPGYLTVNREGVLSGLLSFVGFCLLATVISLSMGIFRADVSAVFSSPDLLPDPDVIGWGYFLIALIPGIWEELAFRGLIQTKLQGRFPARVSIVLSAVFFALFHFSNLLTQPPELVIGGVAMAFAFGIGWGVMTVRSRSVVPAMLSHYLVDSMGQVFLGVDGSNPAMQIGFFLLLTLSFPILNIILARTMYSDAAPAV